MKDFLKKRSVKFALGGALLGLLVSFSDTENGIIADILSGILLGLIVYGIAYLCHYRRKDKETAKLAAAEKAKQEKIAKAKSEKAAKEAEEKRRREEEAKQPKIQLSKVWQNAVLLYHYSNITFLPAPGAEDIADKMNAARDFELKIKQDGDHLFAYYGDEKFCEITSRQDMIKDWIARNDPLLVYVCKFNSEEKQYLLHVAFYRDEQTRLKDHENEIVALVGWKKYFKENEEYGIAHYGVNKGEMLYFKEDEETDAVYISGYGDTIGRLPQKQAKRYLDEDASAVFLDHFDYDEKADAEIPVVKIYWTTQKED